VSNLGKFGRGKKEGEAVSGRNSNMGHNSSSNTVTNSDKKLREKSISAKAAAQLGATTKRKKAVT